MPGVTRSAKMKKINIKPLEPSQKLNKTNSDTVVVGLADSPTQKSKPGSIHDILEQMTVSPDSPDVKAAEMAAHRWQSNAKQIYEEFCTETSFTAITRIYKATNICKKVIWLVLCLGFIAWMLIQIVWLFQKYFSYPVEVKVEMNAVAKLDFPSITVCNLNPMKHNKMMDGSFRSIHDTLELEDSDMLYDDYMEDLKHEWREANVSDYEDSDMTDHMRTHEYNKWDALRNDTDISERYYQEMNEEFEANMAYSNLAVTLDTDDLMQYGHQKEDLIMSCTWGGAGCSPDNFTYLRNNKYGNCYTFNHFDNDQESLYTNYAGPLMGLTLEFNIEQHQYIPALATDAGVRIMIHHRGVYPFPEDEGVSIPPGYKTSIGIKMTEIVRLPPPHADCGYSGDGVANMYTEEYGTVYSKQTCIKSCFQEAIMSECDCGMSFYHVPENTPVCGMDGWNFTSCIEDKCTSMLESCNQKCPSPCQEKRYDVTMSMSKWPSEQYKEHLDKRIQKSSSHFMDSDGMEGSEDTLAKVEIYYQDLIYEKVEQQRAYESQNLISDIGGQLGLWLGLSAITIGELIEFIAAICHLITTKKSDRKAAKERAAAKKREVTKVQPFSA